MAATELVGDVARRLADLGIRVMPVKGALLQHWLYEDPSERPLSDVDLLVRPHDMGRAVDRLEASGYQAARRSGVGAVIMQSPFGLALDLHCRLFDSARYRMPTDDLFARSSEDQTLFGAAVRLPAPIDVYAHLVGKVGSDHLDSRAVGRLDEIARMGKRLDTSPRTVARHLVHCGMRRVSRYVLPLVHQGTGDVFALQVNDSLPFDSIGQGIVVLVRPVLAASSPHSRTGAVMAHLLNDSLPRGVRSGVTALIQRARR
jgi:hypothetical protein